MPSAQPINHPLLALSHHSHTSKKFTIALRIGETVNCETDQVDGYYLTYEEGFDLYTDKVLEHFQNPRNIGIIDDPTVLVQVGEPSCGDALLLTLKIENDHITDIKFKVYGCGAAIATSSIATEMTLGQSLDAAVEITEQSIADALGGLPPEKMHCSNMAAGAIRGAINEYRKAMAAKAADSSQSPQ